MTLTWFKPYESPDIERPPVNRYAGVKYSLDFHEPTNVKELGFELEETTDGCVVSEISDRKRRMDLRSTITQVAIGIGNWRKDYSDCSMNIVEVFRGNKIKERQN